MTKRLRFGLAAFVPVVALAVTMSASGSARPAAPATVSHAADLGPSCYPNNEFTIFDGIGAFSASSAGSASGNGGDASWTLNVKVTGNKSNTSGFFPNPGSLAGSLTATVHVPGVAHTIHFTSHCISAAEVGDPQRGIDALFVIAQGVVDLQPWSPGDNEALVYILVERNTGTAPQGAPGSAGVEFEIAHAKTCDTFGGQQYSFGFGDEYTASVSLNGSFKGKGDSGFRARGSLPAGVTPGPEPCPGIEYLD